MKYQQGDVLFIKQETPDIKVVNQDDGSKAIKDSRWSASRQNQVKDDMVIALGEVTGHSHTFYRKDNPDVTVNTYGQFSTMKRLGDVPKYVEVKASPEKFAVIKHEEHKPLSLPPGLYRTRIVREFDHLSQQTSYVVD